MGDHMMRLPSVGKWLSQPVYDGRHIAISRSCRRTCRRKGADHCGMEPGSPNASSAGAGLRAFHNHDMSDLGFKRFLENRNMQRFAATPAEQWRATLLILPVRESGRDCTLCQMNP